MKTLGILLPLPARHTPAGDCRRRVCERCHNLHHERNIRTMGLLWAIGIEMAGTPIPRLPCCRNVTAARRPRPLLRVLTPTAALVAVKGAEAQPLPGQPRHLHLDGTVLCQKPPPVMPAAIVASLGRPLMSLSPGHLLSLGLQGLLHQRLHQLAHSPHRCAPTRGLAG